MRLPLTIGLLFLVPLLAHAGAWGPGSFENDDAPNPVGTAFAAVMAGTYIQAPDASAAVAAAEVIAAAIGRPHPSPPAELATCIRRQSVPAARRALSRVRDPGMSELSQLWADTKSDSWPNAIAELEARLAK